MRPSLYPRWWIVQSETEPQSHVAPSTQREDPTMAQRTWFITGVNSGFGRHMTEQLLARGDRVAGTIRKMDAMNDLKAKYCDLLWLSHLDVTNTPAIRQVVNQAFTDLG